ncbi:hypothetical protein [Nocardioides sp. Leaf285]|uniref:hypothetical protein n=1 Tax=Nocardioides sp. Leaf285 TaxID=1736322 RepID=UPI0007026819|nr:hypothetical protein [Nocardioides sp. Leaf285]KQP62901.1 hypothetical protein ASF47_17975 [Nocardioides sp. Leaf285]
MTDRFDERLHPRTPIGRFAAKVHREAPGVDLVERGVGARGPRVGFVLYDYLGNDPADDFMGTPVHLTSAIPPGASAHVALGPGRRWAATCEQDDPQTGQPCGALLLAEDLGPLASARARHAFLDHRATRPDTLHARPGNHVEAYDEVALEVGEWVVDERHGVRVRLSDRGEGRNGSYAPDNPADARLLRVDVQVRPEHPDASGAPVAESSGPWASARATALTRVRADHVTGEQRRRLVRRVLSEAVDHTAHGVPIRDAVETCAHLSDTDIPRYASDDPTADERVTAALREHLTARSASRERVPALPHTPSS